MPRGSYKIREGTGLEAKTQIMKDFIRSTRVESLLKSYGKPLSDSGGIVIETRFVFE